MFAWIGKISSTALPYMLCLLFVTLPMTSLQHDMWDGVIVQFAGETQNYLGIDSYFKESTWFLQYWLSLGLYEASDFLSLTYYQANTLLVAISLLTLLGETQILATKRLGLNKGWSIVGVSLLATSPTWGVLLSSIMTFHLVCLTLGMMAVRLMHQTKLGLNVLDLALLFPVYNFPSLLAFLPLLSYLYDLTDPNLEDDTKIVRISRRTLVTSVMAGIVYYVTQVMLGPYGIYENYNHIVTFDFSGIVLVVKLSLKSMTFFLPILVVLCGLTIAWMYLQAFDKKGIPVQAPLEMSGAQSRVLLGLILLSIAAFSTYTLVGKSVAIWAMADWDGRQALLLAVPVSLLGALMLQMFSRQVNGALGHTMLGLAAIALISFLDSTRKCNFQRSGHRV